MDAFQHEGATYAVCSVRDCSDRAAPHVIEKDAVERLETRLRTVLTDLTLMVQHAPAAIALLDRDLRYMQASRRWLEDYGLTGNIIGQRHDELVADIPDRWFEAYARCLSGEIVRNEDDSFTRADGKVEFVRWELVPWRNVEGGIGGMMIFSEIITQRKLAEIALRKNHALLEAMVGQRTAQLESSRDEALRASAAKTRFIAEISHDLRQPLQAAALLMSSIGKRVPAEVADICEKAETSIIDASEKLNGLLDASRLEEGVLQPRIEAFRIGEMLSRVARTHRPLLEAKGLQLKMLSCDLEVESDPLLLARIIDNFVSNAIKYTEHGEIVVGCEIEGDAARIFVKDTGIGIDAASLDHVFDPYMQVDNPTGDRSRGYGLGLAICRTVADALRCKLNVQSTPSHGSTFSVSLALANEMRSGVSAA
ncbi:MAG: PAS domain-containing sensor histidine kinase [Alphaproteobacteria bacterium]|nr:PAS domain-containing sensor histidine kinase [Alphaproteobacteria bacterium]